MFRVHFPFAALTGIDYPERKKYQDLPVKQ